MSEVAVLAVPSARPHPWEPHPVCSVACLPPPETLPRVGRVRVFVRLAAFCTMLVTAMLVLAVLSVFRCAPPPRLFRMLLWTLGVRVVPHGAAGVRTADGGPVLVVSNHLSWLDVLALAGLAPMRMVAKREIRDYPLIGPVCARIGTLFIDRSALRTLPGLVARATEVLRGGASVGLFPEGTTWCGAESGVFRRAGFQAALDAGVPVRPVAQRLLLPDGTPSAVGAFIGEDTVLDVLLRVVRLPSLRIELQVLPLLATGPGTDRRELARAAEHAIAAATGVPAPGPRPHRPAGAVALAA